MPPLTADEHLEILGVHSAAGRTTTESRSWWNSRSLRTPLHTVSDIVLLGGGVIPAPGENSLVNHGALFLDEL
jgi:magnesium chelatase family protein